MLAVNLMILLFTQFLFLQLLVNAGNFPFFCLVKSFSSSVLVRHFIFNVFISLMARLFDIHVWGWAFSFLVWWANELFMLCELIFYIRSYHSFQQQKKRKIVFFLLLWGCNSNDRNGASSRITTCLTPF